MDDNPIVSKEALETEENQALLKLLAHACQLEQEVRALDICKLMSSTTLQIAIKYASKNGRMQLANKISQMACQKQEEEERTQAGVYTQCDDFSNLLSFQKKSVKLNFEIWLKLPLENGHL